MNRLQANLCLVCVTLCWSSEVVLYACIPNGVPAFATSAVTALAASLLLFAPFFRRVIAEFKAGGWRFVASVFCLAALNALYNTLFLYGSKSFDVTSGAFTFCMTVVILPVVLLTMRRRVEPGTWLSVVLVMAGIVLVLGPSVRVSQASGLGCMGVGCLLRAVAIVGLADAAKKHDPVAIVVMLEGFAALISFVGWAVQDPRLFAGLPASRTLVAAWAIYAYFIVAFAQTLNVFSMRRVTAANATIVYSVEIIFSITWGATLPAGIIEHVALTPRIALGAMLVVAGSLAEIADFGGRRARADALGGAAGPATRSPSGGEGDKI